MQKSNDVGLHAKLNAMDVMKAKLNAAQPLPANVAAALHEKIIRDFIYNSLAQSSSSLTEREVEEFCEKIMLTSNDDKLPGCTLPGAQDKVQAQLIDGRYVLCELPGPLHIPVFSAPPLDPRKVSEFRNESGPPSIVDVLIASRSRVT